MPRSNEIELIGKKVDLLLAHDPIIRTRRLLAEELGIDSSQISKWQFGSNGFRVNRVPARHVDAMCALFGVSREWFEATQGENESLDAFELRLRASLVRRPASSEFRELLAKTPVSEFLRIHRVRPLPQKRTRRGLTYPYNPSGPLGAPFHPGDRIWIELTADMPWCADPRAQPLGYLVLLVISAGLTQCLTPSTDELAPSHAIRDKAIRIPVDAPHQFMEVDSQVGPHSVLAILTREPFDDSIYTELREEYCSIAVLERMTLALRSQDSQRWMGLRQRYYVEVKSDNKR